MLGCLQNDMEAKRLTDQEMLRVLVQTQTSEAQRNEVAQKTFEEKISTFETKLESLGNAVYFKMDNHEDRIASLNEAYNTANDQSQ